jgi:hypothetical protein
VTTLEHVGFAPGDVYLYEFDTAAGFRVNLHDSTCVAVDHRPVERTATLRFALETLGEDLHPDTLVAALAFEGVDAFTVETDAEPDVHLPHPTVRGQVTDPRAHDGYVQLVLLDEVVTFHARRVTCTIETLGSVS